MEPLVRRVPRVVAERRGGGGGGGVLGSRGSRDARRRRERLHRRGDSVLVRPHGHQERLQGHDVAQRERQGAVIAHGDSFHRRRARVRRVDHRHRLVEARDAEQRGVAGGFHRGEHGGLHRLQRSLGGGQVDERDVRRRRAHGRLGLEHDVLHGHLHVQIGARNLREVFPVRVPAVARRRTPTTMRPVRKGAAQDADPPVALEPTVPVDVPEALRAPRDVLGADHLGHGALDRVPARRVGAVPRRRQVRLHQHAERQAGALLHRGVLGNLAGGESDAVIAHRVAGAGRPRRCRGHRARCSGMRGNIGRREKITRRLRYFRPVECRPPLVGCPATAERPRSPRPLHDGRQGAELRRLSASRV